MDRASLAQIQTSPMAGPMEQLYRALVFDGDLLPGPSHAQAAVQATCRAVMASGVFTAAEVIVPGGEPGSWSCMCPGSPRCVAALEQPEVRTAAAASWNHGTVEAARDPAGRAQAFVVPVRRAGATSALLVLGGGATATLAPQAAQQLARVGELLAHALDQAALKTALLHDCALHGHAARHDPATGLPNGLAFAERVAREFVLAAPDDGCFAVGLLRRAPAGDADAVEGMALAELARRLRAGARSRELVALLDDACFGLLIRDLPSQHPRAQLEQVLRRWVGGLDEAGPLRLGVVVVRAREKPDDAPLRLARDALRAAEREPGEGPHWRIVPARRGRP